MSVCCNVISYQYFLITISHSCFLALFRIKMSYNTEVVCDTAAVILLHSAKGKRTWTAMELAGFKIEDDGSKKI